MKIACGLLHQTGQYELRRRSWRVLGLLPRALSVIEMRQEALDHGRVYGGDDLHLPATGFAGLDVPLEYTLQSIAAFSTHLGTIPNGGFVDGTGTADIVAGNPDIGKMLIVRLINTNQSSPAGPYVTFDNVRLTAAALIPLPAPGLMLLSGLGGLALLSRTRSRGA